MDVSPPAPTAHDSAATLRRRHPPDPRQLTSPTSSSPTSSSPAPASAASPTSAAPDTSAAHAAASSAGPSSAGRARAEAASPPPAPAPRPEPTAAALHASYRFSVKVLVPALVVLFLVAVIAGCLIAMNSLRIFSIAVLACAATFVSILIRFAVNGPPVGRVRGARHFTRLTGERAAYVRTSQRLSMMDRDFTDADYELLLDLDDNSTRLRRFLDGASQDFIDRLPTYTYKAPAQDDKAANAAGPSNPELGGDTVRRCAICLEDFSEEMQIRILPCFHRFMATCIDPWLLEQGKCPVCKAKVNN